MFDGTLPRADEPYANTVVVVNLPWQLGALLLALVLANYLAAVFWPDVITNADLKF